MQTRETDGGGVTALMRYTLRLLTIQQFERAAGLICACETDVARLRRATSAANPMSLGLWVGRTARRTCASDAEPQLKKLRSGRRNRRRETRCSSGAAPGAGRRSMRRTTTSSDALTNSADHRCPEAGVSSSRRACRSSSSTRMSTTFTRPCSSRPQTSSRVSPGANEAHTLFNLDLPRHPPPELIIQDELHLISGPLGTLAGLYEAAIDLACRHGRAPPKVVASTATIRRADAQIAKRSSHASVRAVPAAGHRCPRLILRRGSGPRTTRARGSTSACWRRAAARPPCSCAPTLACSRASRRSAGRPGGTRSVLDAARLLQQPPGPRRRADAGAQRRRGSAEAARSQSNARTPPDRSRSIELTSRESSADIPGYLDANGRNRSPDALDVVLATNMISVGVDIDRLGLMVVMGQPQGDRRVHPGDQPRRPAITRGWSSSCSTPAGRVTVRTTKRSSATTRALYRQVESTSVTPFSPRARDRALHAALVASVRMRIPELRDNDSAARSETHLPRRPRRSETSCCERAAMSFASRRKRRRCASSSTTIIERWLERAG